MKFINPILLMSIGLLAPGFVFAQTWTQTSAPANRNWSAIASSADGAKLIALSLQWQYYTSTNSGASWITNNEPQAGSSIGSWNCIASSADGQKLVATSAGSSIWVSTNSGATWISNNVSGVSAWTSAAISADGAKLVAVDGAADGHNYPGLIYTSTNSGINWIPTSAPSNYWASVASSADGSKLVAASGYKFAPINPVYVSTNSGATWTLASAPSNVWVSVASSADGSRLVAAAQLCYTNDISNPFIILSPDGIWTSTNSGVTWTSNNVPHILGWDAVASSTDGIKLVAVAQNAIYTSTNSGGNWVSNDAPKLTWSSVTTSADWDKLAAGVFSGAFIPRKRSLRRN